MNIHPAFGGHGSSGVMMGPDGRLYWEVGDIGLNVTDRSGKTWAYPNRGAVMRSDPDGSNFEVFASGIRNLQEFSFDERGNLISVDNDGDYPGESERVVYLPWGSETRLALDLAVRQVHRSEEQQVQRLDRRGHVQAALRRPHRAQRWRRSPTGTPARRAWPTTRARRCPTPGRTTSSSPASSARRRRRASTRSSSSEKGAGFDDGAGADAAQGHPRRRRALRAGRRALCHRLDHRAGTRRTRAASGSSTRPRRPAARSARTSWTCSARTSPRAPRRRSSQLLAARRHARPAEGAVRPRAPR